MPTNALVQIRARKVDALPVIRVTEKARAELRRRGVGGRKFMRVGVANGGCAGWTYAATLDDEPAPNDEVLFDFDDVRIVADREQLQRLAGLSIDFSEDLVAPGFRLTNTNATRACGCGASFSL